MLRQAVKWPRLVRSLNIRSEAYTHHLLEHAQDGEVLHEAPALRHEPESPFRDADGSWIKGTNSTEARLHDATLRGRSDKRIARLPTRITDVINEEILARNVPEKLRAKAATIFQSISKDKIQKAPESELDCDAHIASLFIQDYANVELVLKQLQSRLHDAGQNLQPLRVLDIGYGPATGMVVLNELLEDHVPEVKDLYIVGRNLGAMRKRAKIILSRQMAEQPSEVAAEVTPSDESMALGDVDVSRIEIRTRLRDSLPVNKQYDLIIVNQCLLTREYNFPRDVDFNLYPILRLLSPGGHIVIVERGNALGFETVARARQVMLRPEAYDSEHGKIPRPYVKGSSVKPQKLKAVDLMVTEEDVAFERHLLSKYGEASEDDLKFEFEDMAQYEVEAVKAEPEEAVEVPPSVDYHLKVLAPCPHHNRCPLQLGNPAFYKIPKYKNRLGFCSFHQTVQRPKFTMELKRGKQLSTTWNKLAQDGFGLDKLSKNTLKLLEGSGRPGGNDYESGSYSYLIVERSQNDPQTIEHIKEARTFQSEQLDPQDLNNWPRIMKQPSKQKLNVKMEVCAPLGRIEVWDVPKSLGKQEYHDARKVGRGDLWGLGKKTVHVRNQLSEDKIEHMKIESKMSKKKFLKEERKKKWKKIVSASEEKFDEDFMQVADELATGLENSMKYRQKGKRAGFRVDPHDHDGL